jgi:hypothetical protein
MPMSGENHTFYWSGHMTTVFTNWLQLLDTELLKLYYSHTIQLLITVIFMNKLKYPGTIIWCQQHIPNNYLRVLLFNYSFYYGNQVTWIVNQKG